MYIQYNAPTYPYCVFKTIQTSTLVKVCNILQNRITQRIFCRSNERLESSYKGPLENSISGNCRHLSLKSYEKEHA